MIRDYVMPVIATYIVRVRTKQNGHGYVCKEGDLECYYMVEWVLPRARFAEYINAVVMNTRFLRRVYP